MTCYLYDINTGEYRGSLETCNYITYPLAYTLIPPPDFSKYQIPVYNPSTKKWKIYPDYRGIWYHKETKEELIISQIGDIVDLNEYTDVPCPNPEFYYWDDKSGNWVFDLTKYKEYAIKQVVQQYNDFITQSIPIIKLIGFTSISLMSKLLLDSKTDLLEEDTYELAEIIDDSINILNWINEVTIYEDSIETEIKNSNTKEEVDNILESINFNQFTETLPDTSIINKIKFIQKFVTE